MNNKRLVIKSNVLSVAAAMIIVCSFCFVSCGDEDKSGGGTEYDPSKPVVLTSFHPDSGGIASKVIFDGENFGSDPDKIKVYFNQKPATVIGSSGNRMYAVVPRMPGDTCAVSIVVGNDSVIYGQRFRYKISVTVSDVVGNGTTTLKLGNLSEATLQAFGLCVDDEGNIFTLTPDNGGSVVKANELENSLIQLPSDVRTGWAASPCIFGDGVVCFPSDNVKEVYWTLNPKEGWALKTRYMQFKEGSSIPTNTWKKSMAACELNGHLYTLFRDGHLVKINPETFEAETVRVLQLGESYGLTFHPIKKNLLYISYYDASGGSYAHSICTLDINDIENSFTKITGPTNGGHRDGELAVSQFRNPRQIFFDPEGNLYVADVGNHCIRKITTDDMVETVVGIPGVPGWKNGGKDEALFSSPTGINVTKDGTVYVGDNGNARIRKLAIE